MAMPAQPKTVTERHDSCLFMAQLPSTESATRVSSSSSSVGGNLLTSSSLSCHKDDVVVFPSSSSSYLSSCLHDDINDNINEAFSPSSLLLSRAASQTTEFIDQDGEEESRRLCLLGGGEGGESPLSPMRLTSPMVSLSEASFNITNSVVGIGMLSLPYSFREAGFITIPICLLLTCLYCYTGRLIGHCLECTSAAADELSMPPMARDWQWLGAAAFGRYGKTATTLSLVGELWFVMMSYLVIAGINIELLCPSLLSRTSGIVLSGGLAFALVHANLRWVAYISLLANISTVVAVVAFVWSGLAMPVKADWSKLKMINVQGLHTCVGIINFCFVAHAIFPTIYQSMKSPAKQFPRALYLSYAIAFIAYAATGLFGYCVYGDAIQNPYTTNLGRDIHLQPIAGLQLIPLITNVYIY
eukprot:GHVS01075432.1.p1 GENE.GHVS01075432.1~~GHVS01075432.1.p1  ORF type:complete len:415 (-),score=63.66 GHVS01075432.1:461-1705(-)